MSRPCDPSASSHGFDRAASHSNGTYVCECGGNGEFDAESPAGTERGSEEVMQVEEGHEPAGLRPVARGEEGKTSPQLPSDWINRIGCPTGAPPHIWTEEEKAAVLEVKRQIVERERNVHTIPEKVTTFPERVQIPAESTHVRCPKCTGSILAGKWCNGPLCPLMKP